MTRKTLRVAKRDAGLEMLDDLDNTPWIPLDPETDRGEHGLTPLVPSPARPHGTPQEQTLTIAIVGSKVDRPCTSRDIFGSLEEILIRIDGDTKSTRAGRARSAKTSAGDGRRQPPRRILDAIQRPTKDPPGD